MEKTAIAMGEAVSTKFQKKADTNAKGFHALRSTILLIADEGSAMDPSTLYSTRIQNTFDEDQAEILSIFKEELSKNPKFHVRLINYYKGLPVSFPAVVVSVEKDIIDLDVYPQQAVPMSDHHYTFIRSKKLKHDLFAHVQYVNINRRAVSLRKLCYVEIMAERRNYLRLELDKPQNAHFMTPEGIVSGKLTELSITGACLQINQPCQLEVGAETDLRFMLHDIHQNLNYNVKTSARLVNTLGDSLPRYYRFETTPDKILDRQLAQYIFQRQIEIIQELRDAAYSY